MKRRDLVRNLAVGGGVLIGSGTLLAMASGLRFPVLQVEPGTRPQRLQLLDPGIDVTLNHAYLQQADRHEEGLGLTIRAFSPQPELSMRASRRVTLDVEFCNLSPAAEILVDDGIKLREERGTAVNRQLRLEVKPGLHRLRVRVPFVDAFRFTLIGDSGAGSELEWCLQRSADLGADFMLHLGDLYYADSDFRALATALEKAPVPMYSSIGNHDFHGSGVRVHRSFTDEVGPRNFFFALGETMVVNFDTAASTWPTGTGERGEMFDTLKSLRNDFKHWVLMTHRPLHDPRFAASNPESHALATREVGWVADQLKELTAKPVLIAGHIHVSAEHREDGIHTFISGDGLGARNLVSGREIARILVGEKVPGAPLEYQWQPLEIPKRAQCHDKNRETLRLSGKPLPAASFGPDCPV
jgi:predicted phosphodiesterase